MLYNITVLFGGDCPPEGSLKNNPICKNDNKPAGPFNCLLHEVKLFLLICNSQDMIFSTIKLISSCAYVDQKTLFIFMPNLLQFHCVLTTEHLLLVCKLVQDYECPNYCKRKQTTLSTLSPYKFH